MDLLPVCRQGARATVAAAGGDDMRQLERRRAFTIRLIALVLATAGCSSPGTTRTSPEGPTRAATTQAPAAAKEFPSERYGFQLALDDGWSETDAQLDWDGKK